MASQTVTVLTPHGRRQNVKVTPNMTILQILEEVCKKYDFTSDSYDLIHHRRTLDLTSMFRFSGLPNNAQLEMLECKVARKEANVMICLQLEDGTRHKENFTPSTNLQEIIMKLSPDSSKSDTVIIYMRTEIFGETLATTTIKSLGLTSGSAILRLINRNPEDLKTQANVSAPLPPRPIIEESKNENVESTTSNEPAKIIKEDKESNDSSSTSSDSSKAIQDELKAQPSKQIPSNSAFPKDSVGYTLNDSSTVIQPMEVDSPEPIIEPEIIELGERHAILYSLDAVGSISHDLPDSFFELNVDDIKKILRELRKQRENMDNAPLLTSKLRELEESKSVLNKIGMYKNTVIRVQFADRLVLQGTFQATETIEHVREFVRKYLNNPDQDFHLFVTPPKTILPPESHLIEVQCVPQALLHFGTENTSTDNFLKEEYLTKLTSPSSAHLAATKHRGLETDASGAGSNYYVLGSTPSVRVSDGDDVGSSSSGAIPKHKPDFRPSSVETSTEKSLPKWFKTNK